MPFRVVLVGGPGLEKKFGFAGGQVSLVNRVSTSFCL